MNSNAMLFAVVCILCTLTTTAQKKSSGYEVGAAIGTFIYQGDLTPNRFGSFPTMRPGLIVHGTRILSGNFSLRLNASIASLRGDEARYDNPAFRKQRAFQFRTPLIELSPQLVWSPSGWVEQGPRLSPYLFAGVGFSYLRVRRDWSNFNATHFGLEENLPARIAEDMQRRTPSLLPVISSGAGLRYVMTPSLVLNTELNVRRTRSDYIDGFSIAANPKYKDHYYSVSIGLIYRFGKRNAWDCPPVRN